ncbi:MAG TPA: DUF4845 domain-containing protein [Gammaproteobacteria bacterium]|nr:DUF4845 domain-containing protein [Gammaproteobacteria bacterium]
MSAVLPRRQAGITALGFLILATIFGLVGFGGIKLAPLYMQKMRVGTVLEDVKTELDGTNVNTATLRRTIVQRLYIEGIRVQSEDVIITPTNNGYNVSLRYDNQTSFIGGISFLVAIDEQIEIRR